MESASIVEVDKAEARRQLKMIRAATHREADERYAEIERAYRAAAQGKPILHLGQSFQLAGRHENGMPRLAICRASHRNVTCHYLRNNDEGLWRMKWGIDRDCAFGGDSRARIDIMSGEPGPRTWREQLAASSPVPIIPAHLRPAKSLHRYFTLWEVEEWDPPVPDPDPMLLRHLGGQIYAVIAEWDLTELERMVLGSGL